ncbi:hypothetical protein EE612_029724, partial [Oryza sativa]
KNNFKANNYIIFFNVTIWWKICHILFIKSLSNARSATHRITFLFFLFHTSKGNPTLLGASRIQKWFSGAQRRTCITFGQLRPPGEVAKLSRQPRPSSTPHSCPPRATAQQSQWLQRQ